MEGGGISGSGYGVKVEDGDRGWGMGQGGIERIGEGEERTRRKVASAAWM